MEKTNRGSTRNKSIFNRIGAVGGAIGLVVVLAVLAFSLNYFLASRNQQSQLGSQALSATPTTTVGQIDSTAGWRIYTDTVASYSVKYPPNTDVQEGLHAGEKYKIVDFNLSYEPYQGISISVKDNSQGLSVEQFAEKVYTSLTLGKKPRVDVLHEPVLVSGIKGLKVAGMPSGHEFMIFVPHKDKIYQFSVVENPTQKTQEIFTLMLSTFKIQ